MKKSVMFLMHRRKHQTLKKQTFNERDRNAIFKWTNWFFSYNIIDIQLIFSELDRPTKKDAFSLSYLCFFLCSSLQRSFSFRKSFFKKPFWRRSFPQKNYFPELSTITMSNVHLICHYFVHFTPTYNDRWRKILI